jgi:hypothetical protein
MEDKAKKRTEEVDSKVQTLHVIDTIGGEKVIRTPEQQENLMLALRSVSCPGTLRSRV